MHKKLPDDFDYGLNGSWNAWIIANAMTFCATGHLDDSLSLAAIARAQSLGC